MDLDELKTLVDGAAKVVMTASEHRVVRVTPAIQAALAGVLLAKALEDPPSTKIGELLIEAAKE